MLNVHVKGYHKLCYSSLTYGPSEFLSSPVPIYSKGDFNSHIKRFSVSNFLMVHLYGISCSLIPGSY